MRPWYQEELKEWKVDASCSKPRKSSWKPAQVICTPRHKRIKADRRITTAVPFLPSLYRNWDAKRKARNTIKLAAAIAGSAPASLLMVPVTELSCKVAPTVSAADKEPGPQSMGKVRG